ncbi:MAG TPA: imidazole glycerol phosphate synthase subunit HisH [Gaiellales bacterium]
MSASVTVVDYGAGNLRSLRAAFERLGAGVDVTSDPGAVERSPILIVPGVGAARPAMARLRSGGLADAIRGAAELGGHIIGICLGLQLLFDRSEEGDTECLGLLPGVVRRIDWARTVPHMGWNDVTPVNGESLAGALPAVCYFAHTYVAEPAEAADVAATTELDGRPFASAVARGRVAAVQFHPERSGPAGRALLAALLRRAADAA